MQYTYTRPYLTQYQLEAFFHDKRYGICEASTKSGKTVACLVWLQEQALVIGKPGRNFWWIAPVYSQASDAFRRMKNGLPPKLFKANESDLFIALFNGATIWFKSADRPDTLYGADVWAAVIDEGSRMREESWLAVRSTLTATNGKIRIIGNVRGRNWMYNMARTAEQGHPDMVYKKITAYDAVNAGVLKAEEIEDAKRHLTEDQFRELYLAEGLGSDKAVYKHFSDENVRSDIGDVKAELHIGMDFNVGAMTSVIASKAADELHVFDEIFHRNSNTEEICKSIKAKYGVTRSIITYPDPSGKSRRSSAAVGVTDYTIIRKYGFRIIAPRRAPLVVDRINTVNAMVLNADGRRRLFIHPRCKNLIQAIQNIEYNDHGDPDKTSGWDHITDALGYLVSSLFPIVKKKAVSIQVQW